MAALVAGVEGGGTQSKLVLMTETGQVLAMADGPGTNHYVRAVLVTLDGAIDGILTMVHHAMAKAGRTGTLLALGLSLSGIENDEIKVVMEKRLRERAPELAQHYYICSDVFGSVATASKTGAVCVIAGTGSNCIAVNTDGSYKTCGGWGHVLGDHGSGFDTTIRAVRMLIAVSEGMYVPTEHPPDVSLLRSKMKAYFKIESFRDLLDHAYTHFDKSFFARFTLDIADCARQGDSCSRDVLTETGRLLARHVRAVIPSLHQNMRDDPAGIPIVCVGSLWLAFDQLRDGFVEIMATASLSHGFRLLRLTQPAAFGAAALAMRHRFHTELPYDYATHVEQFFRWPPATL